MPEAIEALHGKLHLASRLQLLLLVRQESHPDYITRALGAVFWPVIFWVGGGGNTSVARAGRVEGQLYDRLGPFAPKVTD